MNEQQENRAVITVVGRDTVGIIAGITGVISAKGINIKDISQTIVGGLFTMIAVVDLATGAGDLGELREALENEGRRLGVQVTVQHEDVFNYMHRV
ncbi:MAG: ACT domain-containing protein [Synergistales bacterium]|nr:ACT domain-containing protein [Synergistales bacterium]